MPNAMPESEGPSEAIQRQIIGEPETIQASNGTSHKVQFELGEKNGAAIVVAVETKDSPARGPQGIHISDPLTSEVYLEVVSTPDDPEVVQAAIEKVRKQIRGPQSID